MFNFIKLFFMENHVVGAYLALKVANVNNEKLPQKGQPRIDAIKRNLNTPVQSLPPNVVKNMVVFLNNYRESKDKERLNLQTTEHMTLNEFGTIFINE